jgi:threonyl-tRNA synthetase
MVAVTFPDGARRDYPQNTTGLDIAKGISPSLAKRTVAMALDGKLADLADPIAHDAKIEFLTRDDPRALELIRHDAAHVLAEAVQTLWPGTQVTIGPVIENGFYYDFFRNEPFTPEDFDAIEKKMREIIARDKPFTKEVWSREDAKNVFRDRGESFKVELVDAIPADQELKIYKQGDWFDRKSATTENSAARWICFTSRRKRPARCSGIRRAGRCSRPWKTTSAAARAKPAMPRSTRRS